MNDKYIIDSFKTIQVDEKSMLQKVKDGIQENREKSKMTRFGKRFNRRFVILVAVLVVVMGFTAVAYGVGLFNLGMLKDPRNSNVQYEFVALEGTNQYKATKEYNDYLNNLSTLELNKLEGNQDYDYDEKTGILTTGKPNAKLQQILNKYHLKYSKKSYNINSPEVAQKKSDLVGFADEFLKKYDDGKGAYIYNDVKRLYMANHINQDYWEIACYPDDVFINQQAFFYPTKNIEDGTFREGYYTTKDGYTAKLISYIINGAYENENGTETPCKMRTYSGIVIAKKHIFTIFFDKSMVDDKDMAQTDFEKILEEFDYSKLDE